MTNEELRETLELLRQAGVKVQLCDTPVGVSISSAHCGPPTEMGDEGFEDYLMLPKELVGLHPVH